MVDLKVLGEHLSEVGSEIIVHDGNVGNRNLGQLPDFT